LDSKDKELEYAHKHKFANINQGKGNLTARGKRAISAQNFRSFKKKLRIATPIRLHETF